MKARLLAALFALAPLVALAQTTSTVTGLPNASAFTGSEWMPADQGGATVRYSPTQLQTYINAHFPGLTGDATSSAGSFATTVSALNGVSLAGLSSGILANTTGTGVPQIATIGGGLSYSSGTLSAKYTQRTVSSGTTDPIVSTDCGNGVIYTTSAAMAVTLPQATGSFVTCNIDIVNGGTGTVTVTPSVSTINGLANLQIGPSLNENVTAGSGNYTATGTASITNLSFTSLVAGAPSLSKSWFYNVATWSGTGATFAPTPLRAAAFWNSINDTAAFLNTGVGATGLAGGYEWYDVLNNGWDGFRFGFECFIKQTSAPQTISISGGQISTNLNCIKDRVEFDASMGGLPGSYGGGNGTGFGFNPFVTAQTNASYLALLSNEFDINSSAFWGPLATKFGLNVALAGNCGSSTCSSEAPAGYDNIAYVPGDADDKGTSFWNCVFCIGTKAHGSPTNLTTIGFGAERRFFGSGTNQFNQPSFRDVIRCNMCAIAAPLTGTYSQTISTITVDSSNTAMTVTFSAPMTTAPAMGSILTITGSSSTAFNRAYVVIGNNTTTTALVSTIYIPTASLISCAASCGTAVVTEPQGYGINLPDMTDSPTGIVSATGIQVGSGGVTSGTTVVSSITVDPEPYAGYVGGAFFGGGNPTVQVATPNGETAPTITGMSSTVVAGLLYTDLTNFVSSASGAPNGTQVNTQCNNGDQLTVTSGTHSVSAVLTIATDGSGHATGVTITTPGAYTLMGGAAPTFTTTGACNTAIVTTWLQVGWEITSISTSGGGGWPPGTAPYVYVSGYTGLINTEAKLIVNLTTTAQPVNFPGGITLAGGPTLTTVASTLAQSSLPITAPASGFVDANGNVIIGANPPGTVFLSSSTAGSGITITCNTACFTGTAAGDTGRVFTFSDGGTGYKTFLVTGNSGASTTIAQGTLNTTLITACAVGTPCAAAGIYETGTNTTTNTAASGTTYPAPLALGYPSGYYSLPVTALGAAGIYYCTTSSATDLTVLVCFNNKYTTGTPTIPGSPTAFSGLTPAAYTQSTSSQTLISSSVGAGSMGLNGCLDWNFSYQYDLSATSKTVAGKLGSAGIGIAATTFGDGTMQSRACNAGAAGVQSLSATYTSPTATTVQTGAPAWSSIATGSAQTAVIQVTLAAATDTLTISNYSITERAN